MRWLTRRGWTPPWLRTGLALALISILLVNLAAATASSGATGGPQPPSTLPTVTAAPGPLKDQGGPPTTLPNAPLKSTGPPGPGDPYDQLSDLAAARQPRLVAV